MPRIIAALVLILLTGCQYVPMRQPAGDDHRPETATGGDGTAEVAELLGYYSRVEGLSEAEIRQRLQTLGEEMQPGLCDVARLKSAMLVSRLRSDADDDGHEDLLAPCTGDPSAHRSAQGSLALLLQDMIALRSLQADGEGELRRLNDELSAAHQENQELRKQLEGLKAIERSIRKRERRLPVED